MIFIKHLIADGTIYSNTSNTKWGIHCKECNCDRWFVSAIKAREAIKENGLCKSCSKKGVNHPYFGKNGPRKGMKCSDIHKQRLSNAHVGKITNDDTKCKLRIAAIEQHRRNGISFPAIDKGSNNMFQFLNMYYGLHIQYPNIELKELGYFLDGYDAITHCVYEYDTKCHLTSRCRKRDTIRQQEIIDYYKVRNIPLTAFYRINATGVGAFVMQDIINNKTVSIDT